MKKKRGMVRSCWLMIVTRSAAVMIVAGSAGCSIDSLLDSDKLPPNLNDPAVTETPAGALAAYHGTLATFRDAFDRTVLWSGLLSDELQFAGRITNNVDSRRLREATIDDSRTYSALQKVRGQAAQAIGLLIAHLPEMALVGHLYILRGYSEVALAELYCSGIPLSTLDYDGGYTYRPGSSTAEVLAHAIALFDTALGMVGDSARFVELARVGRGRALLSQAQYAEAAAAVAAVPKAYRYSVNFNHVADGSEAARNFAYTNVDMNGRDFWSITVTNREGSNGIDWRASADPRTEVALIGTTESGLGVDIYHPRKYAMDGSSPIVLASAVEARLIEAEARLQADPDDGAWLAILNALRTDGTFETADTDPPTTLWHAGTGDVAGLARLADPGTDAGRAILLFRERAFWLFLTGHRQGDLRRLLRFYGRDPRFFPDGLDEHAVYPVGVYGDGLPYGGDVTLPVPEAERVNPLFTGCASRGA